MPGEWQKCQCYGDTSRTMVERILEHKRLIEKMDPDLPMVEHQLDTMTKKNQRSMLNYFVKLVHLWIPLTELEALL